MITLFIAALNISLSKQLLFALASSQAADAKY